MSAQTWVTLAIGVTTVVLTLIIQLQSSARMEGSYGARLTNVEKDITELKENDNAQWKEITVQGKEIAGLKGVPLRPNGGTRG